MVTMEVGDSLKEEVDTDSYDQLMYTQNIETIEPFSSRVMLVKAGRPTQENALTLWCKPYKLKMVLCMLGLTVQNMYTELRQGSKKTVTVVRNNTAYSQTLQKKTLVARAVAALPVPQTP